MTERNVPTTTKRPTSTATESAKQETQAALPRVDIVEDEGGITLWADLPGVPKEGIEVKVEGETLSIRGEVALPIPEGLEPLYAEVRAPRYARQFTLSRELDASQISAQMRDGVLTVRIPKAQHAQPRRIAVQVG